MARFSAVVVTLVVLLGGSIAEADPMLSEVQRVQREARQLLQRLGREPMARRCVELGARRAARLVRRVRGVQRGKERWRATVALTRAYIEAIILRQDLRECRELVGLSAGPSRTRVTLEIDRSVAPAWP